MKNNKRSPMTQARQARFASEEPGLAILMTLPPEKAFAGELGAIAGLASELIGAEKMTVALTDDKGRATGQTLAVDKPQARIAMEATAQGHRENAPELYGRVQAVPAMFANGLPVLHGKGESVDPELTETESALVQTMGHNYGKGNEDEDTNV